MKRFVLCSRRALLGQGQPEGVLLSGTGFDERMTRVVELRFFCGLSVPEVADALEVSVGTVGGSGASRARGYDARSPSNEVELGMRFLAGGPDRRSSFRRAAMSASSYEQEIDMRFPPCLRLTFLTSLTFSLCGALSSAQESAPRHLLADLDGDGLPDLYVSAPDRDDVLLRNSGDGSFVDVTREAGLAGRRSERVRLSDFDGNELTDLLLLSQDGELQLLSGLPGGAFAEAQAGLELSGAAHAEWVDYDLDGWVDVKASTVAGARSLP